METPTVEDLIRHPHLICTCYADEPHPHSGLDYWRYAMSRYKGQLYIIEWHPDGKKCKTIIKPVIFKIPTLSSQ